MKPTDEQFNDPYLRMLTEKWHNRRCRLGHEDQCAFGYGGWDGEYEARWGPMRDWMGILLGALDHADSCGLTLEQFVAYERLDRLDGGVE